MSGRVRDQSRYAGPTLLSLAAGYVEDEQQSYRKTASPAGRATGYQTPPAASAIDERALDHRTVWRLLAWLGCQWAALAAGRKLILERDPDSACHRFLGAVAPRKFRSPRRERIYPRGRPRRTGGVPQRIEFIDHLPTQPHDGHGTSRVPVPPAAPRR